MGRRKTRAALVLGAAIAAAGVAALIRGSRNQDRTVGPAAPQHVASQNHLESCEYFPLEVGTEWRYKMSGKINASFIKRVTEHKSYGGTLCAFTEMRPVSGRLRFSSWERTYSVDESGVSFHAVLGDLHSPAVRFLKLPPRAGETWKASTTVKGFEWTYEFTCSEGEEIDLPAGKFKAIPVKSLVRNGGEGSEVVFNRTEWFSKGIGLVKGLTRVGEHYDAIDLESFTPAR